MRLIFWMRPLKYLFLHNYWGVRKGEKWAYPPEKYAFMLDIGIITIGYAF